MLQYQINNIPIDDTLITTELTREEQIEYDNGKIITPEVVFELDRSYSTIFSSFWYKWRVTVFDTDLNKYLWDGRLINIEYSDSKPVLKLTTVHYLDDTRQVCNLTVSGETPAEIVYQLLTNTTYGAAIPTDYIIYAGFQKAIAIQTAASVAMTITYDSDSETEIKSIIEEICRIASCRLYVRGLYIYFEQLQVYAGSTGYQIKEHEAIVNSLEYEFTDEDILNKYYVAYNSSGTIAYASGSDTTSIATYGRKVFGVPEGTDLETGDPDDDCNILLDSSAAATWCGNLAIALNKNLKQRGSLKVRPSMDYIGLGDQVDLYLREFINEPVKVTQRKFNYKDGTIGLEFDFLNIPVEIVSRDVTAPAAPFVFSAFPVTGGIVVFFTQNQEADYIGNKLYFTSSGDYHGEYCSRGLSPVDFKTTELHDGLLFAEIHRLTTGMTYSVYITAYDSDRNESEPSNVVSVVAGYPVAANEYKTTGDIFVGGVYLDSANSNRGTCPTAWVKYGSGDYGEIYYQPTAEYTSGVIDSGGAFTGVSWLAVGDVFFQYREGGTLAEIAAAAWSTAVDATTVKSQELSARYLQVKYTFHSSLWSDDDHVYIKSLT